MKSKKIYILAILLLAVILTVFFAGCTPTEIQVNAVDVDTTLGDKAYEYLQALASEELCNRTLGTQGELDSAKYIANIMLSFGYEALYSCDEGEGLQEFKTTFKRFDGQEVNDILAYNVVFTKKSENQSSKGEIILACSYDNLYSEKADVSGKLWDADGSYESGSSVAVMLTLAQTLKDVSYDYDLTFAFFTGGCYGWKGAMNYVDKLDRTRLDKIALVVNFAMLGGGDNLYVYTGEKSNTYGTYLNECGKEVLTAVPKDKNIGQFIISNDAIYNYSHIGMLSNQYFFDVKGLPTANFLAHNWGINDNPLFSEMKGNDNVYHTRNDTFKNMLERKGEEHIKSQLFGVIKTTLTALDNSNQATLTSSLEVAKDELHASGQSGKGSTLANIIVKVVLIAVLIAISYVIKTNLTKNIDKYTKAQKAKLTEKEDEVQEPFSSESVQVDVDDEKKSQNDVKMSGNSDKDDPFA